MEIPILFSTDMVQAKLDGRKSQTRRTNGLKHINQDPNIFKLLSFWVDKIGQLHAHFTHVLDGGIITVKSPYGKPGDLLWVREACAYVMIEHAPDLLEGSKDSNQWVYKASMHADFMKYAKEAYGYKWKPSIHMPKDAARIWLKVTNVRVERLQDISEQDAIAEGIEKYGPFGEFKGAEHPNGGSMKYRAYSKATRAFEDLWQSIYGDDNYNANPWVWVIDFEVVSTTGRANVKEVQS